MFVQMSGPGLDLFGGRTKLRNRWSKLATQPCPKGPLFVDTISNRDVAQIAWHSSVSRTGQLFRRADKPEIACTASGSTQCNSSKF